MAFPLNFRDLKNILQLSDVSESYRSSYRIKVSTIGASSITLLAFLAATVHERLLESKTLCSVWILYRHIILSIQLYLVYDINSQWEARRPHNMINGRSTTTNAPPSQLWKQADSHQVCHMRTSNKLASGNQNSTWIAKNCEACKTPTSISRDNRIRAPVICWTRQRTNVEVNVIS